MRSWALVGAVAALSVAFSGGGCVRTLSATTTQPNPITYPSDKLRQSERIFIDIRDMDFPATFALRQTAYFAVVSRDRIRFHVSLVHKWEEVADVTTWHVRLIDDRGRVYEPETKEKRYNDHVSQMWDEERRMAVYDRTGNLVGVPDGGKVLGSDGRVHEVRTDRTTLSGVDVFHGNGDYMFHAPGLFDHNVKSLTLLMERDAGTVRYRFTWKLMDIPVAPDPEPVARAR